MRIHRFIYSLETLQKAHNAGFTNKALLETIGIIGAYTTLQYIRHVANPEHDFPKVSGFSASEHGSDDGDFFSANS